MTTNKENTGFIFGRNNVLEAIKSDRQIDKLFIVENGGEALVKLFQRLLKSVYR